MTSLIAHETAHWGNQIKGPAGEELNFLHKFDKTDRRLEHGNALNLNYLTVYIRRQKLLMEF